MVKHTVRFIVYIQKNKSQSCRVMQCVFTFSCEVYIYLSRISQASKESACQRNYKINAYIQLNHVIASNYCNFIALTSRAN